MSISRLEQDFKQKVSAKVRLVNEGIGRYRVMTPFRFDDGDHLSIVLREEEQGWVLSDEAHTYMHITYDMDPRDLESGTRKKVISNALSIFNVDDHDGELTLAVPDEHYGDALFSFVQALLKITDISYLARERVRSTFADDFRSLFTKVVPDSRRTFDWHHPEHDPQAIYSVDCHINGMPRPLVVQALSNDGKTRDAAIVLLQFERWGFRVRSLAVFEDQENINRKVLARYSNVCEKQFSSITGNYERIQSYLEEAMSSASLS